MLWLRNSLLSTAVSAFVLLAVAGQSARAGQSPNAAVAPAYKHVLLISVDGMHAVDLPVGSRTTRAATSPN